MVVLRFEGGQLYYLDYRNKKISHKYKIRKIVFMVDENI